MAYLLEFSVEIHFSFSRSASIPLAFAVTNMVVSPKKNVFFISYDLKRYWKNCNGLTLRVHVIDEGACFIEHVLALRCLFVICVFRFLVHVFLIFIIK